MIGLQVAILLLLIVANGALAASELAVVSARRARLQQRAEDGNPGARAALELAAEPDRFLSTVQIGITLIGILAGAYGGAALSAPLADALARVPGLAPYAGGVAVAVVVTLITYLSLVVGDLVPKRLALLNAEGIAVAVARPMWILCRLAAPAVAVLAVSSDAALRLIGARPSTEPPVTEEEVEQLLQEGTRAGVFAETERVMVQGVFDLGDRSAGELMTPRHRIVFLDLAKPPAENRRRMADAPHHHFPVCDGSLDRVLGVVSVKTLWSRALAGEETDPRAVMIDPLFVPESAPVLQVMERFKQTGVQLALVVDEYGGVEGKLTLNDVLKGVVGDLDPNAAGDGRAVRRTDGSWLLDGGPPAHEVRALLAIDTLPGEEEGEYETIGGFVMARLGRIPAAGDALGWADHRFEVVDMDGNRVDKVLAQPEPAAPDPDPLP
ncbi:MAG: hemolysin family protein [Chloroflexota bacterium]|nr:hemolysin family protein [Chloroflexota bacterium]